MTLTLCASVRSRLSLATNYWQPIPTIFWQELDGHRFFLRSAKDSTGWAIVIAQRLSRENLQCAVTVPLVGLDITRDSAGESLRIVRLSPCCCAHWPRSRPKDAMKLIDLSIALGRKRCSFSWGTK